MGRFYRADEVPARKRRCRPVPAGSTRSSSTVTGRWPSAGTARPSCSRGTKSRWAAAFPGLAEAVGRLPVQSAILDGEIVALDGKKPPLFPGAAELRGESSPLAYYFFDCSSSTGSGWSISRWEERKERLRILLGKSREAAFVFRESCGHRGADLEGRSSG